MSCFLKVSLHFSYSYNVSAAPEDEDNIVHFALILPLDKHISHL